MTIVNLILELNSITNEDNKSNKAPPLDRRQKFKTITRLGRAHVLINNRDLFRVSLVTHPDRRDISDTPRWEASLAHFRVGECPQDLMEKVLQQRTIADIIRVCEENQTRGTRGYLFDLRHLDVSKAKEFGDEYLKDPNGFKEVITREVPKTPKTTSSDMESHVKYVMEHYHPLTFEFEGAEYGIYIPITQLKKGISTIEVPIHGREINCGPKNHMLENRIGNAAKWQTIDWHYCPMDGDELRSLYEKYRSYADGNRTKHEILRKWLELAEHYLTGRMNAKFDQISGGSKEAEEWFFKQVDKLFAHKVKDKSDSEKGPFSVES